MREVWRPSVKQGTAVGSQGPLDTTAIKFQAQKLNEQEGQIRGGGGPVFKEHAGKGYLYRRNVPLDTRARPTRQFHPFV